MTKFFFSQFEFLSFVTPQHLDNRPLSGQLFAILAMFFKKLSSATITPMSTPRQSLPIDIGKLASSVSPKWPLLAALSSATLEIPWKLIY